MLKEVAKGSKGFLIDGYPREVKQGEQFESEVSYCWESFPRNSIQSKHTVLFQIQEAQSVIFFDVSDDILIERLLKRAKTR